MVPSKQRVTRRPHHSYRPPLPPALEGGGSGAVRRTERRPGRDGFFSLPPWTRDESDASFNRIQKHWSDYGFGVWVVEIQGQFAGTLGFHRPRFEAFFTPCVEIGYRLMPRWWNQGFATEAGQAALCYVFERVGLEEIVAYTTPTNVRSRRVMEKLGMQYSGDFDHPGVPESGPMGLHVLYRLPRSKWVESTHPSE